MSMQQQERLLTIIETPHVSEKSTRIAENNQQIIFKVAKDADKKQVKQAVETLFKVVVLSVNMINVKGKKRGFRQRPGQRSDWKKAMVCLAPGQDIDFLGKESS